MAHPVRIYHDSDDDGGDSENLPFGDTPRDVNTMYETMRDKCMTIRSGLFAVSSRTAQASDVRTRVARLVEQYCNRLVRVSMSDTMNEAMARADILRELTERPGWRFVEERGHAEVLHEKLRWFMASHRAEELDELLGEVYDHYVTYMETVRYFVQRKLSVIAWHPGVESSDEHEGWSAAVRAADLIPAVHTTPSPSGVQRHLFTAIDETLHAVLTWLRTETEQEPPVWVRVDSSLTDRSSTLEAPSGWYVASTLATLLFMHKREQLAHELRHYEARWMWYHTPRLSRSRAMRLEEHFRMYLATADSELHRLEGLRWGWVSVHGERLRRSSHRRLQTRGERQVRTLLHTLERLTNVVSEFSTERTRATARGYRHMHTAIDNGVWSADVANAVIAPGVMWPMVQGDDGTAGPMSEMRASTDDAANEDTDTYTFLRALDTDDESPESDVGSSEHEDEDEGSDGGSVGNTASPRGSTDAFLAQIRNECASDQCSTPEGVVGEQPTMPLWNRVFSHVRGESGEIAGLFEESQNDLERCLRYEVQHAEEGTLDGDEIGAFYESVRARVQRAVRALDEEEEAAVRAEVRKHGEGGEFEDALSFLDYVMHTVFGGVYGDAASQHKFVVGLKAQLLASPDARAGETVQSVVREVARDARAHHMTLLGEMERRMHRFSPLVDNGNARIRVLASTANVVHHLIANERARCVSDSGGGVLSIAETQRFLERVTDVLTIPSAANGGGVTIQSILLRNAHASAERWRMRSFRASLQCVRSALRPVAGRRDVSKMESRATHEQAAEMLLQLTDNVELLLADRAHSAVSMVYAIDDIVHRSFAGGQHSSEEEEEAAALFEARRLVEGRHSDVNLIRYTMGMYAWSEMIRHMQTVERALGARHVRDVRSLFLWMRQHFTLQYRWAWLVRDLGRALQSMGGAPMRVAKLPAEAQDVIDRLHADVERERRRPETARWRGKTEPHVRILWTAFIGSSDRGDMGRCLDGFVAALNVHGVSVRDAGEERGVLKGRDEEPLSARMFYQMKHLSAAMRELHDDRVRWPLEPRRTHIPAEQYVLMREAFRTRMRSPHERMHNVVMRDVFAEAMTEMAEGWTGHKITPEIEPREALLATMQLLIHRREWLKKVTPDASAWIGYRKQFVVHYLAAANRYLLHEIDGSCAPLDTRDGSNECSVTFSRDASYSQFVRQLRHLNTRRSFYAMRNVSAPDLKVDIRVRDLVFVANSLLQKPIECSSQWAGIVRRLLDINQALIAIADANVESAEIAPKDDGDESKHWYAVFDGLHWLSTTAGVCATDEPTPAWLEEVWDTAALDSHPAQRRVAASAVLDTLLWIQDIHTVTQEELDLERRAADDTVITFAEYYGLLDLLSSCSGTSANTLVPGAISALHRTLPLTRIEDIASLALTYRITRLEEGPDAWSSVTRQCAKRAERRQRSRR